MQDGDVFLHALADLSEALDDNIARAKLMKKRIAAIERSHAAGKSFREIVESQQAPLIVRLLTESGEALNSCGARVRRTEALALHQEGMTMDQIAAAFGVTRQRVSALLRDARGDR